MRYHPIAAIVSGLGGLGYPAEALLSDYSFADVLSPAGETRQVALAAFTQTPPSYRTAAFGVVEAKSGSVIEPLLPTKVRGVPRADDRKVLNGIFWRLCTGAPWADIPVRYGPRTRPASIDSAGGAGRAIGYVFSKLYQLLTTAMCR